MKNQNRKGALQSDIMAWSLGLISLLSMPDRLGLEFSLALRRFEAEFCLEEEFERASRLVLRKEERTLLQRPDRFGGETRPRVMLKLIARLPSQLALMTQNLTRHRLQVCS